MKHFFITLSVLFLYFYTINGQSSNTVINTFPYTESFENPGNLAWKIYDIDEDGSSWQHSSASFYVKTGSYSMKHSSQVDPQDGWLVSPKIIVPADANLSFSVWMINQLPKGTGTNRILISSGSDDPKTNRTDFKEKWSKLITADNEDIWEEVVISLAPHKGEEIYIAFQYQTTGYGGHDWYIDDVNIIQLFDKDAGVSAITKPVEGSNLSAQETVTIKVKNYGSQSISSVPVGFEVNGQTIASETVPGSIESLKEVSYTFNAKANLSVAQPHTIKAYTLLPDEQNKANDTLSVQIMNYGDCQSLTVPVLEDFEDNRAMFCWGKYELGGKAAGNTWKIVEGHATSGKRSMHHGNGNNLDSWLVTPLINLSDTGVHFLSFNASSALYSYYGRHSVLISTGNNNPETNRSDFKEIWVATQADVTYDPVNTVLNLKEYAKENIYIAFRYEGNNKDLWYIDDVNVYKIPFHDAGITAVTAPVKGKNLSAAETVTIKVKNFGSEPINALQVTFKVNNQSVTETINQEIKSLEEISYTFQAKANLSAVQKHQFQVFTSLSNDEVSANDTMSVQVTNYGDGVISTFPYTQGFEDDDDTFLWKKESSSQNVTWSYLKGGGIIIDTPHSGLRNACFYSYADRNAICKLITQPVNLTSLSAPLLKFWYAQEKALGGGVDILRVYYKNSASGSWTRIFDGSGTGIDAWTEAKIDLPNPSADYYIAFEGNARIGNGILLDDITIANAVDKDVMLSEIVSPKSAPNLTDHETISIRVKNFGAQPVSNIPVHYQIDSGAIVNETIQATLAIFQDTIYQFKTKADLQDVKTYQIEVYSDLTGDENLSNDTLRIAVTNYGNKAIMGTQSSFTSCDILFVDEGVDGNYTNREETQTAVFYPAETGKRVQANFTKFHTSPFRTFSGFTYEGDTLIVYDGTQALEINRIAAYVGDLSNNLPAPVVSHAPDGALTFVFKKANLSSNEGWEAAISCITPTPYDAGIRRILAPTQGGNAQAKVKVEIKNYGGSPITSMDLAYQFMNGDPVTATYTGNILSGETAEYEFAQPVDVSDFREDYRLKAYTLLANDSDHTNDSTTIEFRYRANVLLRGYRSAPYAMQGAIGFTSNNPGTAVESVPYVDGNNRVYTGGATDDAIYLYTATAGGQGIVASNFVKLTRDWTEITKKAVSNLPAAMTYDYSTDTMWALVLDPDYESSALHSVNLTTGILTPVVPLPGFSFIAGACNLDGQLFGVDYSGNFCSIDKTTGTVNVIGQTGIYPTYLQSMAFDHATGRLFWAMTNEKSGGLIEIDPATGEIIHYGSIASASQVVALHSSYKKTGIDIPKESPISLYPNPSYGEVTISSVPAQSLIRLLDLSGRTVRVYTNLSGEVKLELNLPSGVYFVQIESQGTKTVRKLVVN